MVSSRCVNTGCSVAHFNRRLRHPHFQPNPGRHPLLDGEFTVKRYHRRPNGVLLRAENPAYADIVVGEGRAFEVWGVVTKSIRML